VRAETSKPEKVKTSPSLLKGMSPKSNFRGETAKSLLGARFVPNIIFGVTA